MKFAKFSVSLLSFLPAVVFAADAGGTTLDSLLDKVSGFLSSVVPILLTLALVYFMWGLAKFVLAAGDEKARAEGKSIMIWGVVALFVMVSVWGLVATLGNITGVSQESAPDVDLIPTIPDSNTGA